MQSRMRDKGMWARFARHAYFDFIRSFAEQECRKMNENTCVSTVSEPTFDDPMFLPSTVPSGGAPPVKNACNSSKGSVSSLSPSSGLSSPPLLPVDIPDLSECVEDRPGLRIGPLARAAVVAAGLEDEAKAEVPAAALACCCCCSDRLWDSAATYFPS